MVLKRWIVDGTRFGARPVLLEWPNFMSDPLDWGDSGRVELKTLDGSIVYGRIEIEGWCNGEDEVPIPVLTLDDGWRGSLYLCAFREYRFVSFDEKSDKNSDTRDN